MQPGQETIQQSHLLRISARSIPSKRILVVGLFLSEKNKNKILRTAADQLAELLEKSGFGVIRVSNKVNQFIRFIDTVFTTVLRSPAYDIAIVPMYGGFKSYLWQSITTRVLAFMGKKVVLVVHGGSIPMRMRSNANKYLVCFRRVHKVVCPSMFIATALQEFDVQATVIENVVNLQEYAFQPKEHFRPRVLWMRTLEDIYNPEMAIRVAAILVKRYPSFRMVMAGYDRGSLPLVKQLIDRYGLEDHVELPGYISNEQKNNYCQELDIYICTNRIDNAPVSFIEMMAMGLPVVSVSVGGIPFMLRDEYNGLLVPLDNDVAMADAVTRIIEEPGLGKKLAENGKEFAEQYDEVPVLTKWLNVFNELDPATALKNR